MLVSIMPVDPSYSEDQFQPIAIVSIVASLIEHGWQAMQLLARLESRFFRITYGICGPYSKLKRVQPVFFLR